MKHKILGFTILFIIIISCEKSLEQKLSEEYQRDKAYYESFIDPYTRADGSCIDGTVKVNGKCELDKNTFYADEYGDSEPIYIPTSSTPPGKGINAYWYRSFKDTPDIYPICFGFNFDLIRADYDSFYDLNNGFMMSYPVKYYKNSGYKVPIAYQNRNYIVYISIFRKEDGHELRTQIPASFSDETGRFNVYAYGKFSKDYKYLKMYLEYKIIKDSAGMINTEFFYKRTKEVTLEYH